MATSAPSKVSLTDEQRAAVDVLFARTGTTPVQTLGGYAGVGKTTVIKSLVERLPEWKVCAYTGKATQVLKRKGIEATTIHALIYKLVLGDDEVPVHPVEFELVPPPCEGIIVDEASMVGKSIYDDLTSLGVPLIFVGDHGQLEPVGDGSFNLMQDPQVTLTKIHRNAGEIARFAEHLRMGRDAKNWVGQDGLEQTSVSFLRSGDWDNLELNEDDQMICAYNKTRVNLNALFREATGRGNDGKPVVGDRVICLQNDRRRKLYNGMQGTIEQIDRWELTFRSGDFKVRVPYLASAFGSERKPEYQKDAVPFDFAYCVTAHKAQGDEWDRVVVFEQRCGAWEHSRWCYTSASRAKTQLTWVLE